MPPRRYTLRLLLLLAAGLLSGHLAQAQVHELPTRFYLLPRTQHRYDSANRQRVTRRCWLLRYTERRYAVADNGTWYLDEKDRASWFFGRVTRQVRYRQDKTKRRVYRYRRNFLDEQLRPISEVGKEHLVAARYYQKDGKERMVIRYRAQYYKLKQRQADGKMPGFHRLSYRTTVH
ncbi:hypothetical protein [Hymenobacter jeollabukensis]|uniref:Uncharacterized protein n=1 Tax=Hymenobacter jeollabukensis TaxID=2025313 RepID=A0A5R8WNL6_9BACT|nr:hypothetical protein [Hymenobacter jeollabukensis]TLM91634.1 hypothetical protein FDY95_13810 [Hymenobacter jeollabukensis]